MQKEENSKNLSLKFSDMEKRLHLTDKNRMLLKEPTHTHTHTHTHLKLNSMVTGIKEELENEFEEISQKVEQKDKEM